MWWQAPFQFTACALYKENSTRIWNTLKNPDLIEESGIGSTAYILLPDSSCSFHLWLHWQNRHLLLLDDDHWKAKRIQVRNPAKWKLWIWCCHMKALNLMLRYASSESDAATWKLWIWCCHMKALNLMLPHESSESDPATCKLWIWSARMGILRFLYWLSDTECEEHLVQIICRPYLILDSSLRT